LVKRSEGRGQKKELSEMFSKKLTYQLYLKGEEKARGAGLFL
jgi:hypothetical protein